MEVQTGILISAKKGINYTYLYEYYKMYVKAYYGEAYIFNIWERGKEHDGKFSFRLKIMDNGQDLKVVDLYPDADKYYLGKGISISIIKEVKSIFNKRIISSSNKYPTFRSESRRDDASKKVWERLVLLKEAFYDKENDYFHTI
jgi:hypothetical protein